MKTLIAFGAVVLMMTACTSTKTVEKEEVANDTIAPVDTVVSVDTIAVDTTL